LKLNQVKLFGVVSLNLFSHLSSYTLFSLIEQLSVVVGALILIISVKLYFQTKISALSKK